MPEVTSLFPRHAQPKMPGDARDRLRGSLDAECDTSVLDRVIAVEQLRANGADIRPDSMRYHLAQPAAVDHLDIVVEHHDHIARRLRHGAIVYGGVIERAWEPEQ